MKISIVSLAILLSFATALAQEAGKISGSILKNAKPADGATISLLRAKDSSIVKLSASGKEGSYAFENIAPGKYLLSATAVGHRKAWSPVIEVSTVVPHVQMAAISLMPETNERSLRGNGYCQAPVDRTTY
jgi:hypothetical protein